MCVCITPRLSCLMTLKDDLKRCLNLYISTLNIWVTGIYICMCDYSIYLCSGTDGLVIT